MKNTKLTNVKALEMVLAMEEVQNNAELVEKLETMKAQFEKKNASRANGEKKPTKTQLENMELAEQLKELLTEEPQPQKELQAQMEVATSQKMTAIVKILVEQGVAVKETIKGVASVNRAYSLPLWGGVISLKV